MNNVFFGLWKDSEILENEFVKTIYCKVNSETNKLKIEINPKFWESLSSYDKVFNIAKVLCDVKYHHSARCRHLDPVHANVAKEVVVNQMLVDNYSVDKDSLKSRYYWMEDVFPNEPLDKSLEYYYNILARKEEEEKDQKSEDSKESESLGSGSKELEEPKEASAGSKEPETREPSKREESEEVKLGSGRNPNGCEGPSSREEVIPATETTYSEVDIDASQYNWVAKKLNDVEKEVDSKTYKLEKSLENPEGVLMELTTVKVDSKISKEWDNILSDIELELKEADQYQFVFKQRRHTLLSKNFMIPSEFELEDKKKLPDILMFLDFSGSCSHLFPEFITLATSIDRKKYNVRLFSRTTTAIEFDFNCDHAKVPRGSGSDNFGCIENLIQKELSEKKLKKYPIVIHITDGGDCAGKLTRPECPEKWYWILSGTAQKNWIDPRCKKIFSLSKLLK